MTMNKYNFKENLKTRITLKDNSERIIFGRKIKKQYQQLSQDDKNEVDKEIKETLENLKKQTKSILTNLELV